MSSILLVSGDDALRDAVRDTCAREGVPLRVALDMHGAFVSLTSATIRVALVDARTTGIDPTLLARVASCISHRPAVRVVAGDAPGLPRLADTGRALGRLARSMRAPVQDPLQVRALRWAGLGPDPMATLARAAGQGLPVLVHGERGTGKARVARTLLGMEHAEVGEVAPEARWEPGPAPGAVYFPAAHRQDPARIRAALAQGWRVAAGSRDEDPLPGVHFTRLHLPPLRERPDDLRQLAQLYLDHHGVRLGVGRRRLDRGAWALLHAHRWTANARELEAFVVDLLVAAPGPVVRGATMPAELRARLLPRPGDDGELESFELAARARLAPVVALWEPVGERTLHAHVIDATERALLPLVLARTEGNRKRAAAMLGLARNTLQARITRLGLDSGGHDDGA
jgi:DNA-binding NtrC family response regulator